MEKILNDNYIQLKVKETWTYRILIYHANKCKTYIIEKNILFILNSMHFNNLKIFSFFLKTQNCVCVKTLGKIKKYHTKNINFSVNQIFLYYRFENNTYKNLYYSVSCTHELVFHIYYYIQFNPPKKWILMMCS